MRRDAINAELNELNEPEEYNFAPPAFFHPPARNLL